MSDRYYPPEGNHSSHLRIFRLEDVLTIIKLDTTGQETWKYSARVLEIGDDYVVVEAYFDRQDIQYYGMLLGEGDRFVESYFTNRWYNIYQIHAREDNHIRGWYCNVSYPINISNNTISYIDLALDLLVFPDGRQVILDEAEFNEIEISPSIRNKATNALRDLKAIFNNDPLKDRAYYTGK